MEPNPIYIANSNVSDCESIEVETSYQPTCSVTRLKVIQKTDNENVKVYTLICLFGEKDKPLITSINGKSVSVREIT